MTPERAARLVARWVAAYTNGLPATIRDRRIEELAADVDEQIAVDRSDGVPDRRIAAALLSRMARGMPADLAWRDDLHPLGGTYVKPYLALFAAALGVAALALVLDSTALVLVSAALLAVDILGVGLLGLRMAQRDGAVVPFVVVQGAALAVAAIGVFAIVWGESDDAPGLVLLGIMVIVGVVVGAFALGRRTAERQG